MHLSLVLVFALNILGTQSRAQHGSLQTDPVGTRDITPPLGDCICTPFYKCYDEESSSSLIGVDDRSSFPLPVISTRQQELDPKACQDILSVCCYKLTPQSLEVNTQSPPDIPSRPPIITPPEEIIAVVTPQSLEVNSQNPPDIPSRPPIITPPEEIIADLPTSCTGKRPIAPVGATCGVRNPCGVDFAFSGFKDGEAQNGEFPWMVAVLTSNTGFGLNMGATNLFVGGGSLIHPQVVLTAAHKAIEYEGKILTARLGEWNFASTSEPINHTDIRVREIIIHPRYNSSLKIYNTALLILERPATLGETVGTICLADNPDVRFDGHQDCIVSGWGKNVFGETGRYQRILKSLTVNIVNRSVRNDQCQSALQSTRLGSSFELHPGFICAGDKGQDACTGDGGSPLVCPHPSALGQYIQVGVVAWGIGCGKKDVPGVYWAVTPMMGWIECHLNNIEHGRNDLCERA